MIPRGIEILVKKASVDPKFNEALLRNRSGAAGSIGLKLAPNETAMLDGIPESQLKAIIAETKVTPSARPAFMGYAATAMLAALVGGSVGTAAGEGETFSGDITSDGFSVGDGSIVISEIPGKALAYVGDFATGIRPEEAALPEAYGELLTIQYKGGKVANRSRDDIISEIDPILKGPIAEAYAHERSINDSLSYGEVTVQFTITKEGTVTNLEIITDGIGSSRLCSSILDNLNAVEMKSASGDISVVYSFDLYLYGDG